MPEDEHKDELKNSKIVALIVAHPDDEILWAGGTILSHPEWSCYVVCLCRGSDTDRAPKFVQSLNALNAEGIMGDLDDGPEQFPLDQEEVAHLILSLLPPKQYDLIITHNPKGEYTRHIRHEETGKAVIMLWQTGKISTSELWIFAYEDGNKKYFPKPVETATVFNPLSKDIWMKKYRIITETYGFKADSWEAETTPLAEAFWKLSDPNSQI